jgi:hypothetical protein
VHKTGDVQGGRDDADAVANDLGRDEESVHSQRPLGCPFASTRFAYRLVGMSSRGFLPVPLLASEECPKAHQLVRGEAASQSGQRGEVRFGSQSDMCSAERHVCFTPKSGRLCCRGAVKPWLCARGKSLKY